MVSPQAGMEIRTRTSNTRLNMEPSSRREQRVDAQSRTVPVSGQLGRLESQDSNMSSRVFVSRNGFS